MTETKNPSRKAFVFSFVLIVAAFFLHKEAAAQQGVDRKGPPPVPVRVAKVEKKAASNLIELVGTAEPVVESTVASEVSGVVESFPVREGDFVSEGQILARLGDRRLRLGLKAAVAEREKTETRLEEARKELDRMEKLKVSQSVAEKAYDTAFYLYKALTQDLMKSKAEIEQLEYEIGRKKIVAPFSGFVSREHTQVGQWVNVGGAIVDLIDLGRIEATVDVPERYAVQLSRGDKVSVVVGSLSPRPRDGAIETILPQGDPNARTFPVKISLENPDMKIKSGMETLVSFTVGESRESLVVHKDAVVISGKDRLVFVVKDGVVAPVPIVILGYFENYVTVEGGLSPGDLTVVRGNERLRPGQAVKVFEQ